jgi:hypothetical protein
VPVSKKKRAKQRISRIQKWKVGCTWKLGSGDIVRDPLNLINQVPLTRHLANLVEAQLAHDPSALSQTSFEIPAIGLGSIMEGAEHLFSLNDNLHHNLNANGFVSVSVKGNYYLTPLRKAQGGSGPPC